MLDEKIVARETDYAGDIAELIRLVASADLLVAGRFHASVLGALLSVPTVMVAYNRKTADFVASLGQEEVSAVSTQAILDQAAWASLLAHPVIVRREAISRMRGVMVEQLKAVLSL